MTPWRCTEEQALRILGPRVGGRETAAALGRSYESTRQRAKLLGVRLRRTSDPKVTLPAGEGLSPAVAALIERAFAPLCPACATRYVTVTATGMCGPCHVERRIALHRQTLEDAQAQRDLWAARSMLQRRRRALARLVASAEPPEPEDPLSAP